MRLLSGCQMPCLCARVSRPCRSEDGGLIVLHADNRPACGIGLLECLLGAGRVVEFAFAVVVAGRAGAGTVCPCAERVELRGGGEDLCILPGAQGREDSVLCLVDRLGGKLDRIGGVGLCPLGIAFGHVRLNRGLLGVDSLA